MKTIKRAGYVLLGFLFSVFIFASCGKNELKSGDLKSYGYEGSIDGVDFVLSDLGEEVAFKNFVQRLFLSELNKYKAEKETNEGYMPSKSYYYNKILDYAGGQGEFSRPDPVILSWNAVSDKTINNYIVSVSENRNMEGAYELTTDETQAEFYNLKTATKYFWRITAITDEKRITSGEACFTTADESPRTIFCDGVTNFRDLGGYKTEQGKRVKQGSIYRCAGLNYGITQDGIDTLSLQLGIKTEIDLRQDEESGCLEQGYLGVDMNYYRVPMTATLSFFIDNADAIKEVFDILSVKENYPLLFHCAIGTDRTGAVAFLVNGLLGASEDDLYLDYMWSNFGKIGGLRYANTIENYLSFVNVCEGKTLKDRVYNYLKEYVGVKRSVLDKVISILI